ncbi:MAG: septal ring lytic transglycosylase RlpA family protein [Balneolaceae bacterium]
MYYLLKSSSLFFLAIIFLSACGTVKRGSTALNPPTTSSNNSPIHNSSDARALESGMASWYGPTFHGKLTANGETYDQEGVTAAHRTLPFGTVLLVENLENGRTVQVRVNDRGPFAKDRIIDLSKGAAETVDMIGPGTARVRLYLLEGDLENSRVTDLKIANFTVQLGSFKDKAEAQKQSAKITGTRVENISVRGETFYRVYFGTYQNPDDAKKQLLRLQGEGFAGFVKQIEND